MNKKLELSQIIFLILKNQESFTDEYKEKLNVLAAEAKIEIPFPDIQMRMWKLPFEWLTTDNLSDKWSNYQQKCLSHHEFDTLWRQVLVGMPECHSDFGWWKYFFRHLEEILGISFDNVFSSISNASQRVDDPMEIIMKLNMGMAYASKMGLIYLLHLAVSNVKDMAEELVELYEAVSIDWLQECKGLGMKSRWEVFEPVLEPWAVNNTKEVRLSPYMHISDDVRYLSILHGLSDRLSVYSKDDVDKELRRVLAKWKENLPIEVLLEMKRFRYDGGVQVLLQKGNHFLEKSVERSGSVIEIPLHVVEHHSNLVERITSGGKNLVFNRAIDELLIRS